jgi:hypothetical protein
MKTKEINQQEQLNLQFLLKQVEERNKLLSNVFPCPELRREWIPRAEVMKFLGFGATQISEIIKKHNLRISRIGKRQFFSTQSLQKALNESQLQINKEE